MTQRPYCTHPEHDDWITPEKYQRKHECTRKKTKGRLKGQRVKCPWLDMREPKADET